jgi:hypothetical protein
MKHPYMSCMQYVQSLKRETIAEWGKVTLNVVQAEKLKGNIDYSKMIFYQIYKIIF